MTAFLRILGIGAGAIAGLIGVMLCLVLYVLLFVGCSWLIGSYNKGLKLLGWFGTIILVIPFVYFIGTLIAPLIK